MAEHVVCFDLYVDGRAIWAIPESRTVDLPSALDVNAAIEAVAALPGLPPFNDVGIWSITEVAS